MPGRGRPLRWDVALAAGIVLWLLVLFWAVGYVGRVRLRDSQVNACQRALPVRKAQAASWRAQASADQIVADDPGQPRLTQIARSHAAARHRLTARVLEDAAAVDCKQVNPPASLLF